MKRYITDPNDKCRNIGARFIGTPFHIMMEEKRLSPDPNTWSGYEISVFKDDKKIGSYVRNYHSMGLNTFYPFMINDQWYALYSCDYTSLRVAKIGETFEDWCGEERDAFGFCPVEVYVPRSNVFADLNKEGQREFAYRTFDNEYHVEDDDDETKDGTLVTEFYGSEQKDEGGVCTEVGNRKYQTQFDRCEYLPFGFLSGCVWGDDTSWKIRYIDLSQIEQKILTITEKFGYIELPDNLELPKCVQLDAYRENQRNSWIRINHTTTFNITTGEKE